MGGEISGHTDHTYLEKFVPAFDLGVETSALGIVQDYHRSLDFAIGVATVG